MAERIVEDSSEIGRLLGLDLPVRADGAPEEREVAIGWTAVDERAEITSFIPATTKRLLALAKAGEFEIERLYLEGEDDGGLSIVGVEGLFPKELVALRKRRRRSDKQEGPVPEEAGPSHLTKGATNDEEEEH